MNTELLNEISENLQRGKAKVVKELVQKAIDEGIEPDIILNEGLLSGMNIIGEKFKTNEVYVPEVLVAARAMNMGVGGMDKTALRKDKAAVDAEIVRMTRLASMGGFIPCPDHRLMPGTKFELVQYYAEEIKKIKI